MKKIYTFFHIWGVLGALMSNTGERKFQGNIQKCAFLAIRGALGGP